MRESRPICNVTELLESRDVRDLMTVNGFSSVGSAYDRFRALCLSAQRQPHTPTVLRLQAYLENAFGCDLPMCGETCGEIWRQTSEALFFEDVKPVAYCDSERSDVCPPSADDLTLKSCFLLNGINLTAPDWTKWREMAERILQDAVSEGKEICVSLPKGYTLKKTNLYKTNQVIAKGDWSCPSWISQLVYFLCDFCATNGLRGGVLGDYDPTVLLEILQHVSNFSHLPRLYVACDFSASTELLPVCGLILSDQAGGEAGVPPVLVVNPS